MNNWCIIYGCMYAGKSSKLQSFIKNCKQKYVVFTHSKDTRYGLGIISTHNGNKLQSFMCENITNFDIVINDENPQSIFIDEVQFFSTTFILHLIKNYADYRIYFSGLDKDFNGNYFDATQLLISVCKNKLNEKALCECGDLAEYSKIVGEKPEQGNISIGNHYKPVCVNCFYNL